MTERIGLGYDIHRFIRGRKLYLGGVEVPYIMGLDGHSDADVVLHAICDALLGALGQGDIGEHFPNTDPAYAGISSVKILEKVYALVRKAGYGVKNIDVVIIAEKPNLKGYKALMQSSIAGALEMDENFVNIKATTAEGLGAIGRGEGLAAYATVLLSKKSGRISAKKNRR